MMFFDVVFEADGWILSVTYGPLYVQFYLAVGRLTLSLSITMILLPPA